LQRPQGQAEYLLDDEQHLDRAIGIDARTTTSTSIHIISLREQSFLDPHCDISPANRPLVVLRPVSDAVACFGLGSLMGVLAHSPGKNREFTQESELLTAPDEGALLVYDNASSVRPIYATTPTFADTLGGNSKTVLHKFLVTPIREAAWLSPL
jgi:hypothetical protein